MTRIESFVKEPADEPQADAIDAIDVAARAAVMLAHPRLAVAIVDRGRIHEINPAWKALFALPEHVAVESQVGLLFPNVRGADRVAHELQAQFAADGSAARVATAEHLVVRRDGSTFLAEILVWLFHGADAGHPMTADAIWQVRDITAERALGQELRELEDYHHELARHQWDLTFVIDRKGRISYASPSVERVLGHRTHAILGEPFTTLLAPAQAAAAGQWLRSAAASRRADRNGSGHQLVMLDHERRERPLVGRARNCFDVPRLAGLVVHLRDVARTDSRHPDSSDAIVRRSKALHARILDLSAFTMEAQAGRIDVLVDALRVELDAQVALYRDVDGAATMTASPSTDRPDLSSIVIRDDLDERIVTDAHASSVGGSASDGLDAAGMRAWVDVPVFADGAVRGRLIVACATPRTWEGELDFVTSIAQLIASARKCVDDAVVADRLTGLPDRASARRWLDLRIADLPSGSSLTMLALDLDRLQDVNVRRGHAAGDTVIARAAQILQTVIGGGGYVARVDGDAFVVLLVNATTKAVDETVTMILERLQDPAADALSISASIGVARLPDDAATSAALWQYAELALREAKVRGRGQAFAFNDRLAASMRVRRALETEIADGMARDEFVLFYQPQIAFATGKVVGLEALLRWNHPTRGLLLPDVFIDAAVERGLIEAITKSVLGQVCEQLAAWRRTGAFGELPVGVNVAGSQFHDRRLPALVASALLRSGLPARLLVLEIAEQSLVGDDPETERVVKELERLGVRTAVGSFALGHGAVKQLRQLHVAQIKLGRGFVSDLAHDDTGAIVVIAMIDIARRLKCQVVAEGVETRAQFEQLRTLGCEVGQGFFFGAPLSADEIQAFVEHNALHPIH